MLKKRSIDNYSNHLLPKFSVITAKAKFKTPLSNDSSIDKVAIYTTCYHNYNEPQIINDLVLVLQHNNIDVEIIKDDKCCGMPKLELGDLETVEKTMQQKLVEELANQEIDPRFSPKNEESISNNPIKLC